MGDKIITAAQSANLIEDGQTVATGGFVGSGVPEALLQSVEDRFLEQAHPRDLTLVYAAGQGDGKERGLNHLGHKGLVRRIIGGHWGLVPKLGQLGYENELEAYIGNHLKERLPFYQQAQIRVNVDGLELEGLIELLR